MALFIDPPSGWKYGFPKPIPEDRRYDSLTWLVEQGYPQAEIDALGEHFYCRYWSPEKATVKFNGGELALLCSGCSVVLKTGKEFTKEEMDFALMENKHLDAAYCEKCKDL